MPAKPDAEARAASLVKNMGEPGSCRACRSAIFWLTHRNGRRTPYDPDGTNHFITCPEAESFRRRS